MKKLVAFYLLFTIVSTFLVGQTIDTKSIEQLKFRHLGPIGNRLIAAVGIPGDPLTYYAGAATGGIWKTQDGGWTWKPIFDDKPVHAIGSLAVAPSDHQVVWAGTGESFIRSNVSLGNGVWRSTDGGANWSHLGLAKSGRIGRIVVHPLNPDVAYVAALGHAYQPQDDKGIYRTLDGGKTWERILFVDAKTGGIDIVMDPANPRILFAAMWQLELKTWNRESGGPGSGIYMSRDGGNTWKKLEKNGLPEGPVGKISLTMSKANPDIVYALIETGDGVPYKGQKTESGELWRSDDKGQNWKVVNFNRDLGGRQAYYTRCVASPDNAMEIYFMAASFYTSTDGGITAKSGDFSGQPNWDHHDMWIDPTNAQRMIVAGDGGVSISINRGKTWHRSQLPVAQLYHVTTDNKIPYNVITNRQDGPSFKGPSRTRAGSFFGAGVITRDLWHTVGGGESGFSTPDPVDPDIIWSSASGFGPLGGIVELYNEKSGQYRHLEVWPEFNAGTPAKDSKYRFQWTFPLLISPHDRHTVYITSQHVHKTTDGGQSWQLVSPDLTMNDQTKQDFSGGLTGDNINVEYANVIFAFEESPIQKGLLWAGTNDGQVQISKDGGQSWTNLTNNLPGLPPLGTVRNIEASKYAAGRAYLTVDLHQVGDFKPYVYKTDNFGQTWTKITQGIPESTLSYACNIIEDPVRPGLLYLGTENALYISFNDGAIWQSFMSNLPATPMYWLTVQEHFNDLVLATYGRGIWVLDDLSPIQALTEQVATSPVHLFQPKPVYRFRPVTATMGVLMTDPSAGQDPPDGAALHFWLKEDSKEPVKLHIINSQGDTLKTLTPPGKAGINRVWWNLYGEASKAIVLRTPPQYADWVTLDKNRTRKSVVSPISVLTPPGTYKVVLESGKTVQSQDLVIKKDPNSLGSEAEITEQTALVKSIAMDLDQTTKMINQLEMVRRQVYDQQDFLKGRTGQTEIATAAKNLDSILIDFEGQLIQLKITGTGQDDVRWPGMLAEKLSYLAGAVATADFKPADSHREVYEVLRQRLKTYSEDYIKRIKPAVNDYNSLLKKHQVDGIIQD